MSTRIYRVSTKGGSERLVEAATQAQAIRWVSKGLIIAKTATAKETADLMKQGVELEVASEGDRNEEAAAATV